MPGLSPNLRRVRTISRGTSLGRRVPREPTLPGDLSRDSLEGTNARTSTRGGESDTKSVSLGIVKIPNSAPGSAIFEAQKVTTRIATEGTSTEDKAPAAII